MLFDFRHRIGIRPRLEAAQRMLLRLGIVSRIYRDRRGHPAGSSFRRATCLCHSGPA